MRVAVPELKRVYTHIEPLGRTDWTTKPTPDEVAEQRRVIEEAVRASPAPTP